MAHPLPRYLTQVVLPYAMFAALWIFLSDQLLLALVDDEEWRTVLQTYKGLAFVTITSLLLYELLRRVHSRKDLIRFEQERLRNRIFDILESMTDGFVALDRDWRYQYLNARAAEMLGRDPSELIDKVIWIEFPEGRDQDFYHAYQRVMKTQQAETIEAYYPPWQRWYENRIYPSPEGLHIFFQDVTARKQAEAWREGQSQVLAQIIAEQPLSTILETLIYVIESQALGSLGTVMLMDDDDQHLHYGAGPSLPPGLAPAIDGMAIGASAGACGTAAFTRQLVIIEDFQTDPRGVAYRALAQQLNLHACWSQPIFSAAGNVLGTFAMYYTEPRTPLLAERQLIAEAGHMAAVAIEAARNRNALLASETRFRSTFEQAAVGIAHVAPDGRFLRINQRYCDIVGYPFQELLNLSFQDITHAEDLDADVGQVQRVLADEIQIYSMEKRYLRKNASIVWVMLTVSLVRKADATPDYFIAVIEDISEQKRVASLLHSSEARLRLALDAAQMGTFDWDIANNHTTWSYWHEALWGFKPGEFDGRFESFAARVDPNDLSDLNTEIARCISAHEPFISEFRVVWPNATVHWISARGEFYYNAQGQAIRMRGVVREVTAHKAALQALQKSEEQLRLAIDAAQMGTYDWDIPINNIACRIGMKCCGVMSQENLTAAMRPLRVVSIRMT